MVPVAHQQGGRVGFKLGEQLHHRLALSALPDEHLDEGVIHRIGILRHAGVNKLGDFIFQAQPVQVHLHVVRNLPGPQASSGILPFLPLRFFLFSVMAESGAAPVQEAQHRAFQVHAPRFPVQRRRKERPQVLPEAFPVLPAHFFNCGITHAESLPGFS